MTLHDTFLHFVMNNRTNTFQFIVAFKTYSDFWNDLKMCPGVKKVEVAQHHPKMLEMIEKGYYLWRVVTDSNGILIPSFKFKNYKVLFDNGWTYNDNTHNDTDNKVDPFTCVGQACFNKLIVPPNDVFDKNIIYVHEG